MRFTCHFLIKNFQGDIMPRRSVIRASALLVVHQISVLAWPSPASAAESIPPDILQAVSAPKIVPPTAWTFGPDSAEATSPACDLVGVDLQKATESKPVQTFPLLTGKSTAEAKARTQILVKLPRMAVDADGAARAYHPADPTGRSVCEKVVQGSQVALRGICALDHIANAGVRIFKGTVEIPYLVEYQRNEPDGTITKHNLHNPQYESTWRDFWPLAAARKVVNANIPFDQVVLYSSQQNVSALFKTKIFPFQNGLPCVQGARDAAPGYFVSETAPTKTDHASTNQCDANRYRESTKIPYFVIPDGLFTNIRVGDVAIGYAKTDGGDRIVRGIVGDIGPKHSFGEASIAFNQKLRDDSTIPMNSIDTDRLDTDLSDKGHSAGIKSMFVLLLGDTAKQLKENYSADNIDRVARLTLQTFKGEARLRACVDDQDKRDLDKKDLDKKELDKNDPAKR